jgi:hypothetical protein
MSDLTPLARAALFAFLVFAMAVAPAHAATKKSNSGEKSAGGLTGLGVGALLPQGSFADFNDPSYLVQSRSLYVEKVFGGRAAAYYGDTAGAQGADGGRVYGFDFDLLLKFGSSHAFGYVFGGAGYGTLTYTSAGSTPGSMVRRGGHDWCWTGGVGFTFRRKGGFYLEASYVSFQTNPEATEFIPVVIGYQF